MSNFSTLPNMPDYASSTISFGAYVTGQEKILRTKYNDTSDILRNATTSIASNGKEIVPPVRQHAIGLSTEIDATVIHLWEGRVLDVDCQSEVMQVLLTSKLGHMPEHTAEIELQWVSQQDRDLVTPGAVFYLTLYKETRRGSIRNSQELRFRRLPAWSKEQVKKIYLEADLLLSKAQPRPVSA